MRLRNLLLPVAPIIGAAGLMAASDLLFTPIAPEAPKSADAKEVSAPLFYGSLEQSNEWGQTPKVGFYNFGLDGSGQTLSSPVHDGRYVTGGGAYVDGYVYFVNGVATYQNVSNTFNKLDVDTWEIVSQSGHQSPTKTDSYALAYDHSTSTMYAFCPDRDGNARTDGVLRTVDLTTGQFTDVANVAGYIPAIAFDAQGQLWGIERPSTFPHQATLVKIDKTTGAKTTVGQLGYNQKSEYAGMVFDYRTGKLYWTSRCFTYNAAFEESHTSYVVEVNLATGKATPVKTFDYQEVYSTIFMLDCHPKAPEAVTDLEFEYSAGSDNDGSATFTMPTLRYDRTALTGTLSAEVYVDGTLTKTLTGLQPGAKARSEAFTLADGKHKIRVYCYDSAKHKSIKTDLNTYGGRDVPEKVRNLTVAVSPYADEATLSWEAPTVGSRGGNFDSDRMTYKVIRRPDMVTVAQGLTTTGYTDKPDRIMTYTQYEVVAETPSGAGESAYTQGSPIGQPVEVTKNSPYLETFDNNMAFMKYTVIDVNGIGTPGGDRFMYWPEQKCAVYWLNYDYRNRADAWLVTPTLKLDTESVYRLQFSARGWDIARREADVYVCLGEFDKAESLKHQIYHTDYVPVEGWYSHTPLFVAEEKDMRLGFHLVSPGQDHLGIDNVRVAYYGPSTIPAAPELVSVEKDANGSVRVKYTAPATDTKGRKISSLVKVTLKRANGTTVKTTNSPIPGNEYTITDANAAAGINNYMLVATNGDGDGLETIFSFDTNSAKPLPVADVTARVVADGDDVDLSWEYPAGYPDADGGTLTPEQITYDVYRQSGERGRELIARSQSTTSLIDRGVGSIFNSRQTEVKYHVVAVTSGGSAEQVTADALVGASYQLPLSMNEFYYENMTTGPWVSKPMSAWTGGSNGYTPRVNPNTGKSLMRCMPMGASTQTWTSPRFNMTGLSSPKLTFSLYCLDTDEASTASIQIGAITETDGLPDEMKIISESFSCRDAVNGWKTVTVDLSKIAKEKRASIVFVGHATQSYNICIDDVEITGTRLPIDLRVVSLQGPTNCIRGRDNIYKATIHNNGTAAVANGTATLSVDGEVIESQPVNLEADKEETLQFNFRPALNGEDIEGQLKIAVNAAGDGNPQNDDVTRSVTILRPNVPYVGSLRGTYVGEDRAVALEWDEADRYPRAYPVKDDFESYPNFIIDNIGDWTLVDADGANTIQGIAAGTQSFTWTNAGVPQAYIVFNPARAGVTGLCQAYSGDKCLVAFTSAQPNDDWLISPRLIGAAQTISFYAAAVHPSYAREKFEVLISRSGTSLEEFTLVESFELSQPTWQRYEVALPAGARHFAIRCVSNSQFGLMLDDIEYIPAQPEPEWQGYNVYCDDALLAGPIGETEYVHQGVNNDETHVYQVSALYDEGESIYSDKLIIDAAGLSAAAADTVTVVAVPGAIIVSGAAGLPVSVTAPDGRVLYHLVGTGHDTLRVPAGVYIVTAATHSGKYLVK